MSPEVIQAHADAAFNTVIEMSMVEVAWVLAYMSVGDPEEFDKAREEYQRNH